MWALLIVSGIYILTFAFGTAGNLWVMVSMVRSRVCHIPSQRPCSPRERSRVFIFFLAVADFIVLLTIPFSLSQNLQVDWPFGSVLCRLHAAIDYSGKFFSVVILMSMSIERYLIVCTRWRYVTSPKVIMTIPLVMGVLFSVIVPIIPQVIYTRLLTVVMEGRDHRVCYQSIPTQLSPMYTSYTFAVGFAIPLCVMTICYIQLVQHVRKKFRERKQSRTSSQRPKYMCELTRSICRIAVFHFSCWAPFWFFNMAPIITESLEWNVLLEGKTWFEIGKLFANMLPYINSAGNCILYAFLNRDIRKHIIWRPSSSNGRTITALPSETITFNPSPTT
ncbi:unnamed protein product [Bursaphelenchus xylophilus]|uniref:(pine wood nematode) hypothetical protein n=1 Tax=Bursaphelenchus xylophilus TaxID=6326 RepID=A0A1I7S3E3_BURXY|nr:unnamed protein product [Bursaphelenchus xylophilus]CAG9116249.1 unnamed protein product [Bursaphelenchus xylophilus]